MTVPAWMIRAWQKNHPLLIVFAPCALLIYIVALLRKHKQQAQQKRTHPAHYHGKIVVVGNITLGGSGKTTCIWWLAKQLSQNGYAVAIVSKGYGRNSTLPIPQRADTNARLYGDEPAFLASVLPHIPVWVGDDRLQTIRAAIKKGMMVSTKNGQKHHQSPDFLLCDDGLQDYRFKRFEIALIDGDIQLANRKLFPWGILRELPSRLHNADVIWQQNSVDQTMPVHFPATGCFGLRIIGFTKLIDNTSITIKQARAYFGDKVIHICAGLANNQRVFHMIAQIGFSTTHHAFSDHYQYTKEDFHSFDGIILLTPKDAIKCRSFCDERMWQIQIEPWVNTQAANSLLVKLATMLQPPHTT